MTRTATGLGIAAALGFAVSLGAQTTTSPDQHSMRSDKSHEITVTGCLARGSDGTFMLNNARMDEHANSSTTTATATTGTTAAEPSSRTSTATAGAAMSYKLEGGKDLERHVGHEIEVTGRTDSNEHSSTASSSSSTTTTTTGTAGAAATTTSGARLDVSSVKMISSSCK